MISDRIKMARNLVGLSQKEVAARMKVSPQSYHQYESGKRNPKGETIQKIAAALGLTACSNDGIDWYFDFSDEQEEALIKGGCSQSLLDAFLAKQFVDIGPFDTEQDTNFLSGLTTEEVIEMIDYKSYLIYKRDRIKTPKE